MRKWGLLGLAIVLVAGVAIPATVGAQSGGEPVRVAIAAQGAARAELAAKHGVRHDFGSRFTTDVPPGALAALSRRSDIQVELVPSWRLAVVDTAGKGQGKPGGGGTRKVPGAQVPWGIHVMYNGTLAGADKPSGGSVRVAILDTGLYTAHPDFYGKTPFACKDYTGTGTTPVAGCKDDNGHGTHVAGTIAATGGQDGLGIYGVAPAAEIGSYKVCGRRGCYVDDIAAAIDQAVADGARIISMSLGADAPDSFTGPAVQRAVAAGVLVVAAAGNDGSADGSIDYPGAYAGVVAVASVYQETAGDVSPGNLVVNSWSSRGIVDSVDGIQEREVELAAPGYLVESTWKDGGYNTISGTSMATPHVSGLAARHWQGSGSATRAWLQSQAQAFDISRAKLSDGSIRTYGPGYDNASGFGNPRIP